LKLRYKFLSEEKIKQTNCVGLIDLSSILKIKREGPR